MMKKLLLSTLMLFVSICGFAYDCEVDGIYYDLNTADYTGSVTYEFQSSRNYSGVVHIPEEVVYNGATYNVTCIGDSAFYRCWGVTELTIPNSVTCIGDYAFYYCYGLTVLTIPNNVTSIGDRAFDFCYSLTELTIGNNVASIGRSAFRDCSGLTELTIPNSVISIGDSAFQYCSGLTELAIGNGVTSIGEAAFSYCRGLIELTIPNNVTIIGDNAFTLCSGLKSIMVEEGNLYYDSRENCNAIIRTADNELVVGCKNTLIPISVTSIGNYAFYNCSELTELTIPNSVLSIGEAAFSYCSGLTELTIPNSVTIIGDYAFYECSGLTELTIPNSVISIGAAAFSYCSGLAELTIPNCVTIIGDYAFYECSGLKSIMVEEGNLYYDSRENCNAIIRTADNELVVGCKNTLIPVGVTSISNSAFYNCSELTELTIPNSVTSIGDEAFYGCSGLTGQLLIPNNVTSIGNSAFGGCSGLTELTIGNSVIFIGDHAFSKCSSLVSITSLNTTPPMCASPYIFAMSVPERKLIYENVILHVPAGSKSAYEQATVWKEFLNIQEDAQTDEEPGGGADDTDGIGAVNIGKDGANVIYTINGKRLNTTAVSNLPAGIYIVNGKKVLVK